MDTCVTEHPFIRRLGLNLSVCHSALSAQIPQKCLMILRFFGKYTRLASCSMSEGFKSSAMKQSN